MYAHTHTPYAHCINKFTTSSQMSVMEIGQHTHLPPRSQMVLKGERSKAVTTSLPQMFQMEFINCMNFNISSSDLHTHTKTVVNTLFLSRSSEAKLSFVIFCSLSKTNTHERCLSSSTDFLPVATHSVYKRRGAAEEKSLW